MTTNSDHVPLTARWAARWSDRRELPQYLRTFASAGASDAARSEARRKIVHLYRQDRRRERVALAAERHAVEVAYRASEAVYALLERAGKTQRLRGDERAGEITLRMADVPYASGVREIDPALVLDAGVVSERRLP